MIVTITSCAPVHALSAPAMPAQSAPAASPATRATIMWRPHGRSSENATQPAAADAISIWPRPPMLNMPMRNASATPRPGRDERRREGQRLGERTDAARERRRPEVVDRALEERDVRARTPHPRPRRSCPSAARRSSRAAACTSSSVNAIMMPPTISASTTASTEMIALPCVICRKVRVPLRRAQAVAAAAAAGLLGGDRRAAGQVLAHAATPSVASALRRPSSGRARRAGCRRARSR